MSKGDHEYFNCSEEHELNYVSSLYTDPKSVKLSLIEMCEKKIIKNSTHAEVYELLKSKGFKKK